MGRTASLCGLALLFAACGPARTWVGPPLPTASTAVVRVTGWGDSEGSPGDLKTEVRIRRIDGAPYRGLGNVVQVLPGPHVIEIEWWRSQIPFRMAFHQGWEESKLWVRRDGGCTRLHLDAEAGRVYRLTWTTPDETAQPKILELVR